MTSRSWDVIVVGGGCAGLSAATALSEKGKGVLVFERRPLLGGRASSFQDRSTGEILDNGQHLFLGCYVQTQAYLRRIGMLDHLVFRDSFEAPMVGPNGERATLKTAPLPAPLHMAWALLRYRALRFGDRLGTFRVARASQRADERLAAITVSDWLSRQGQSRAACERLWIPITLAALNIHPDHAPADLMSTVLREGFLASRADSRVGLADLGLSDLHGEPSQRFLEAHGGEVRRRTTIEKVERKGEMWQVEASNGSIETCRALVLAIPPSALVKLFSAAEPSMQSFVEPLRRLKASPILSFHVWFDREPFDEPFVGFWGREFHWAFSKQALFRDSKTRHFSLVVSAAESMFAKSREELISICEREIRSFSRWPCRVERAITVREPEATWIPPLSPPYGRLETRTPFEKLYLAGDWTATGLPATIEGAVKSGHWAAREVLKDD